MHRALIIVAFLGDPSMEVDGNPGVAYLPAFGGVKGRSAARTRRIFRLIVTLQIAVYLEAGAVPCLLNEITDRFSLTAFQQGCLGGVVYVALSVACPLAAFLFHRYSARLVIATTLVLNCISTIAFGLVPASGSNLLIFARSLIGFSQVSGAASRDGLKPEWRVAGLRGCSRA